MILLLIISQPETMLTYNRSSYANNKKQLLFIANLAMTVAVKKKYFCWRPLKLNHYFLYVLKGISILSFFVQRKNKYKFPIFFFENPYLF